MAAYMIILAEIDDMAAFMPYAEATAKLIEKFGGEYLVRGATKSVRLEGDWPDDRKAVISQWPSVEAAEAFWYSPEYTEIKKLREGTGRFWVRVIEAV